MPNRNAPLSIAIPRGPWRRIIQGLLAAVLLLGSAGAATAQTATAQTGPASAATGRVTGRIEGAPENVKLEGTRVVLVQFKMDEQGVPSGNPIQSQTAAADGSYTFAQVPIVERTVYQVGATVNGQVVGSQPFAFPSGEREVLLNLRYPQVSSDASAVRIEEGLIAVEPRRGEVLITEVLHLVNPGQDVVEGIRRPLELELPRKADRFEMIREIQSTNGHERLGGKLLFYGNLDPGRTTVAFRYRLPVWLGTVELEKRYPHTVTTLSVLTPEHSLRLVGGRFAPRDAQVIDNNRYNAWAASDLAAGVPLSVRLTGVPVRQEVYLLPLAGFFAVMVGVVLWFLRRRLRGGSAAAST